MNIKSLKPSKSSRYQQGYIDRSSCKKIFEGLQHEQVIYRSSYELKFITWLENCKDVKAWDYEGINAPYIETIAKYFPISFMKKPPQPYNK